MTTEQKSLPIWILIVSAIFVLLELLGGILLCMSPQDVVGAVDVNAKGVDYVFYMWAVRQFALASIFAFATIKKSGSMLTVAYVFFSLMMIGDLIIGILQKENAMIVASFVMLIISSAMLFAINRKKNRS